MSRADRRKKTSQRGYKENKTYVNHDINAAQFRNNIQRSKLLEDTFSMGKHLSILDVQSKEKNTEFVEAIKMKVVKYLYCAVSVTSAVTWKKGWRCILRSELKN